MLSQELTSTLSVTEQPGTLGSSVRRAPLLTAFQVAFGHRLHLLIVALGRCSAT